MNRPAAYIFDLDGVVYHGNTLISGANKTIEYIMASGSRVIFLTNNATRTRDSIAGKLNNMGICCSAGDVISSAYATAAYIKEHYGPCIIYPIGEHGLVFELEEAGHTIAKQDVDLVVVGLDREFTYQKLAIGLDNIIKGARFIATNTDAMLPVENGFLPGAGSMVSALKTASGIEPEVIGKPQKPIMDILLSKYSLKSEECIMVGDRLETDILAGLTVGMHTILVLTGASGIKDIESSGIRPGCVMNSIVDIISQVNACKGV